MSEQRRIDKAIEPKDLNFFKRIAIDRGLTIEEGKVVTDWYGRIITDRAEYLIGNKHSRLKIGVDLNGRLYYDSMSEGIVDELLADYYEKKLSKRGYKVRRTKEKGKIKLEVYR